MQLPKHLRPWMLVSAAWIIPAGFAVVDQIAESRLNNWGTVSVGDLLWTGGDWFLYAFLTPGVFAISRKWPLTRPHLARRVMFHLAMSLLFCIAWATCGKLFQLGLAFLFDPQMIRETLANDPHIWRKALVDWLSWIFTTFPFGIAVYLCIVGIEHAVRYFVEARDSEVQMARLSEQLSDARFAALQAQVNPHFLFNTLNTIAVLVRDNDREGAVGIVEHLSEVLRRTLNRNRANEVTLGEELDLVRQYLAIEQARFSDRLKPEFEIEDAIVDSAIPSFALQHLVENAVRHGITKDSDAGRLKIIARHSGDYLVISVVDDGPGIDEAVAIPPGHGIENTRERLRALYGERASLAVAKMPEGGTIATLRVPYREIVMESSVPEF